MRVALSAALLVTASSCMVTGIVGNTDVEDSSSSTATGPKPIGGGMAVSPPNNMQQAVSIASFDNVLRNMNRVTGTQPSSETIKNYNQNRTTFPQKGTPDEINAAMWMSISTLAANVCLDLYNKEKAISNLPSRAFFPDFSLTANSDFNLVVNGKSAKVRMIERMARAFWGRDPSSAETNMILSMALVNVGGTMSALSTLGSLTVDQAKQAIILTCTPMLASLEAIQN